MYTQISRIEMYKYNKYCRISSTLNGSALAHPLIGWMRINRVILPLAKLELWMYVCCVSNGSIYSEPITMRPKWGLNRKWMHTHTFKYWKWKLEWEEIHYGWVNLGVAKCVHWPVVLSTNNCSVRFERVILYLAETKACLLDLLHRWRDSGQLSFCAHSFENRLTECFQARHHRYTIYTVQCSNFTCVVWL